MHYVCKSGCVIRMANDSDGQSMLGKTRNTFIIFVVVRHTDSNSLEDAEWRKIIRTLGGSVEIYWFRIAPNNNSCYYRCSFITFMCRLSRNSGASNSGNPKVPSRPVEGKLYLYLYRCSAFGFRYHNSNVSYVVCK